MNQVELFRNALMRSVESLLNAETQVRSHIEWFAEMKRSKIEKAVLCKTFNSDDICDYYGWQRKDIEHNVEMKAVAVRTIKSDWGLISKLRSADSTTDGLFDIRIVFLRNPRPILDSKVKLTDNEKSILKKMRDIYDSPLGGKNADHEKLMRANIDLHELKHHYQMAFEGTWSFTLSDIIDEFFPNVRLKIRNESIG